MNHPKNITATSITEGFICTDDSAPHKYGYVEPLTQLPSATIYTLWEHQKTHFPKPNFNTPSCVVFTTCSKSYLFTQEPTARSVLGRVDTRPFRNFLYNRYTVDEKRDTERESYRAVAPLTGYNSHRGGSQPDNHPTLAALYNLAVKLAKGLQH